MSTVLEPAHDSLEIHSASDGFEVLAIDQPCSETDTSIVDGDPSTGGPRDLEAHGHTAAGGSAGQPRSNPESNDLAVDPHAFDELRVLAECFEDAQKSRIAISNRIGSGQIPAEIAALILASAEDTEHKVRLALRRSFKRSAPVIYAWSKDVPGLGDHLMARLIGTIGHPVYAFPHHWEGEGSERVLVADEPFRRNVAKLWAYCGYGDPSRKRKKGMTADDAIALGNPRAKMILRLLAEACLKCVGSATPAAIPIIDAPADPSVPTSRFDPEPAGPATGDILDGDEPRSCSDTIGRTVRRRSPYRDTYDMARAKYADHEDWTPGHQHAAALRLMAKDILRDLWIAAQ